MPDDRTDPTDLAGQRLHFTGIGGVGMSGLARLTLQQGAHVTGSDRQPSPLTDSLRNQGVSIVFEQTASSLPDDVTTLVISAAVPDDHPEVRQARSRGIEVVKYAAMLGRMMKGRTGVAIAGTHGKSSTTSMLGHALVACGLDPSVLVGAHCPQLGGGARLGTSDVLLAEACEFDRSFHALRPTHAAVLNVEADHLDQYADLGEIVDAFAHFTRLLPAHGSLLIQHGTPHRMDIAAGLACPVETIGFEPQADWRIGLQDGTLHLHHRGEPVCRWRAAIPGEHMAYNAAVAAVTAHRLGAPWPDLADALAGFQGLDRRMQHVGDLRLGPDTTQGHARVIDDYGHHPTEVDTTLRALRQHHTPGRLFCVFQPHQHSRTRFLMQQFATSFAPADRVLVPDIYFVRDSEAERQAVTAQDLVDALNEQGTDAAHFASFDAIVAHLRAELRPGDLIVTMGAGNVGQIAHTLVATQTE